MNPPVMDVMEVSPDASAPVRCDTHSGSLLRGRFQDQFAAPGRMRHNSSAIPNHAKNHAWWILSVIAGFLSIRICAEFGKLAASPRGDDLYYMTDGLNRLQTLCNYGPGLSLREFITSPPHSIFSSSLAAVAFLFAGLNDLSPYLASIPIIVFFFWHARILLRKLPAAAHCCFLTLLVTVPIFGYAVTEFRPDFVCAFAQSCGLAFIFSLPLARLPRRWAIYCGAIFGLALWTKPTVAIITTLNIATGCILAYWSFAHRQHKRSVHKTLLTILGLTIATSLPLLIVVARHTFEYIQRIQLSKEHEIYKCGLNLTPLQHLTYYLPGGPVAEVLLGNHCWIITSLLVILLASAIFRRAGIHPGGVEISVSTRVALSISILLLVNFLAVAINPLKTCYLGVILFSQICIWSVFLSGRSRIRCNPALKHTALMLLLMAGITLYKPPLQMQPKERKEIQIATDAALSSLYTQLIPAIKNSRSAALFTISGGIGEGNIIYLAMKNQLRVNCASAYLKSSGEILNEVSTYEYVVTCDPGCPTIENFYPSYFAQQELNLRLPDYGFKLIRSYPITELHSIHLYKNMASAGRLMSFKETGSEWR